jgi:hypothetical protein
MSKLTITKTLFTCASLLVAAGTVNAQGLSANVYFGLGTATDSSNGQQINTFANGTTYSTPEVTGLFGDTGASLMFNEHWGVGGEFAWRLAQGSYAGLSYRPEIYDFNAIWQPAGHRFKRFVPEVQAGIGGADIRYYANSSNCSPFLGCSSSSQFLASSDHFQVHASLAARFYVTPHIFLRPAVDAHWVDNFSQFGSNWVPQYTLGVGYTFGGER